MEDGKEFWDGMEDFCYGTEENARMEDGNNVFHFILSYALLESGSSSEVYNILKSLNF